VPPFGAAANPIDVTAQVLGTAGALGDVLGHVLDSPQVDAAVLVTTLAGARLMERERERLAEVIAASDKPLLVYSYTQATADAAALMSDMHLAWYTSPRRTARVLGRLVEYARARERTAAAALRPGAVRAGSPLRRDGRMSVPEHEAKALLREWGLPTPRGAFVTSDEELIAAAGSLRAPLVLKAQAATLLHKTEAQAVTLGLPGPSAAVAEARLMRERVAEEIDGFLIEEMLAPGVEMIAGALVDPDLGPFVLAGVGGIFAEILGDAAVWPAPLLLDEARALIEGLRGAALLDGARGAPPSDREAFARCLVALGDFVVAHQDEVREIDLNPVRVGRVGDGVCVLDAAIVLAE